MSSCDKGRFIDVSFYYYYYYYYYYYHLLLFHKGKVLKVIDSMCDKPSGQRKHLRTLYVKLINA